MLFTSIISGHAELKTREQIAPSRRRSERFFLVAAVIITVLCAWQWLANRIGRVYQVPSRSMEPTLQVGDTIAVNQDYYSHHPLERGHVIIIFRHQLFVVTRLIGLPGDTIEVSDTSTKINGSVVAEPYLVRELSAHPFPVVAPQTIPEDEIFVMGDNRSNAYDSRHPDYGPVYTDDVVGRASFVLWSKKTERIGKTIE